MSRRTVLRGAGGVLLTAGVLALLFVAYEFLVTGLVFDRSQGALLSGFKTAVPTTTLDAATTLPAEGGAVALMSIPRLGVVNEVVVEGTSPEDLKNGPGHLSVSPLPGEFGNSVIAGRRTTYGGPFRDLNLLRTGDVIRVVTGQGSFTYTVLLSQTFDADSATPLVGTLDSRLTLVTSDPAYLPTGRLVVVALLHGAPVDVPSRAKTAITVDDLGLVSTPNGIAPAALWLGLLALSLGMGLRFRRRWPDTVVLMFATPVVIGLTVMLYSAVDASLPGML
jgi:sortase A